MKHSDGKRKFEKVFLKIAPRLEKIWGRVQNNSEKKLEMTGATKVQQVWSGGCEELSKKAKQERIWITLEWEIESW